jgi:hypothetical protein
MATLDLTYKDVWTKVAEYLGLGSSPTGTDLTKVKDITKRGYRKFLMPIDLSTAAKGVGPKPYRWSFLRQTTTLATVAGTTTYALPDGYNGMIIPLTHTTSETINPIEVPLEVIYVKISQSINDAYPLYFAVKDVDFDPAIGRKKELIFYPNPDKEYTYYYTYRFIPLAPENDDDFFVGPVGSSEAILETCLAAADLQEKDNIGFHATEADRLTQQFVGDDKLGAIVGNIGSSNRYGYPRRTSIISKDGNQLVP